jgi:hypothetical protein
MLGFPDGNLGGAQGGTGAVRIATDALLRQWHLDLRPSQPSRSDGHGGFRLSDAGFKIAPIELCQELAGFYCLMVCDVHSGDRAIHLGADGDNIADHVGVVRRDVRVIVLPELQAVRYAHYQ